MSGSLVGMQVLLQGLLLQLYAPLQFLGSQFRRMKKLVTDMEAFLGVMHMLPGLAEGHHQLAATADLWLLHAGCVSTHAALRLQLVHIGWWFC